MAAPARPTSDVSICNLALARIGQSQIASISSPNSLAEDKCALHYPMTRRALFRAYVFNFTKKYAELTVSSTVTPTFGFASAFPLPTDFIRLLGLGDVTINGDLPPGYFDVVPGYIYTSEEDDEDTLNIYYVFDNTNVGQWDALFINLMRLELAKAMAYAFTLRPSLIKDLDAELADVRLAAAAVAGQEKPPRRIQRSKWVDNRRAGGSFRDPTRYSI